MASPERKENINILGKELKPGVVYGGSLLVIGLGLLSWNVPLTVFGATGLWYRNRKMKG